MPSPARSWAAVLVQAHSPVRAMLDNVRSGGLAVELAESLTLLGDQTDRTVIAGWVRWHALPRLRRRVERGVSTTHSGSNVRRQTQQVLLFVAGVENRERTLATCTQSDIDRWFAQPGKTRAHVRAFLAWAADHKHIPVTLALPNSKRSSVPVTVDSSYRWQMARKLVTDDTIAVGDRVAGALLVLYAQPLTRIAALTIDDVLTTNSGTVTITVTPGVDIELVEPFDSLILQLPIRRRAGISDQLPTKWLFPGPTPNRHAAAAAIATRLRILGIEPRKMRASAVAQLAAEIPPAILAGTIGITAASAARWAAIAGGDWTRYAASTARTPASS